MPITITVACTRKKPNQVTLVAFAYDLEMILAIIENEVWQESIVIPCSD